MKLGITSNVATSREPRVTPSARAFFRKYADEVVIASRVHQTFATVQEALAEAKHTDECVRMVLDMTACP